jgi:hypothetical protein
MTKHLIRHLGDRAVAEVEPVHVRGIGVVPDESRRLPVIPEHLSSWAEIKSTARRHFGRGRHHALFHGVRLPVYLGRTMVFALAGVARVAGVHLAWVVDARTMLLAADAAGRGEHREYLALSRHGRDARRVRVPVLIVEAVALAGACLWLALAAPWWVIGLVLAAVVPVLAAAGKPTGKPLIKPATVQPRYRVINADVVIRAYTAPRLCDPEKPGQNLIFQDRSPIHQRLTHLLHSFILSRFPVSRWDAPGQRTGANHHRDRQDDGAGSSKPKLA